MTDRVDHLRYLIKVEQVRVASNIVARILGNARRKILGTPAELLPDLVYIHEIMCVVHGPKSALQILPIRSEAKSPDADGGASSRN